MTLRKTGGEQEFLVLRRVVPQVPMKEEDVETLREDLQRMGCAGLLFVPWGFQEEGMVRELMGSPPSRYHKTPRAHLETWNKRTWQRVLRVPTGRIRIHDPEGGVCQGPV